MDFDTIANIKRTFLSANIDRTIHPKDGMANHHRGDWEKYEKVGVSAVEVILKSLALSHVLQVRSIMDFGCGYGRVARQLRGAFPDAAIHVTDIDQDAIEFNVQMFGCLPISPARDFRKLILPENLDIIWIGSVFTHITEDRMRHLLDVLAESIAPNGIIVATFHGDYAIKAHSHSPLIYQPFWEEIVEQFKATGIGHHPYGAGRDGGDNWGISLSRPDRVMSLSSKLRCVGYLPQGWINFQDVALFCRA